MNSDSLGARLRTARKGLGKSQDDMAAVCGVSREMWGKYERDAAMPGGEVLIKVALAGIDVNYILTGQRMGGAVATPAAPALSPRKAALLDHYEATSEEGKKIIEAAAFAAAQPAPGRGAKVA